MARPRIMITGCNGLIGRILWQALDREYELYGLDIHLPTGDKTKFAADIAQWDQVRAAFNRTPGLDFVIHLAGVSAVDANWEAVLHNNIEGTRNVYENAHHHGVRRIIFASSNHVTGAYEGFPPDLHTRPRPDLISTRAPIRPDGFYGVSKAAGEALARMYYDLYGLESICLRIGTVLPEDDPGSQPRFESTWLSHRDRIQLVRKSLSASVGFGIYYGVSNNRKRFWDISNAESELGYRPEDNASDRIHPGRKEGKR